MISRVNSDLWRYSQRTNLSAFQMNLVSYLTILGLYLVAISLETPTILLPPTTPVRLQTISISTENIWKSSTYLFGGPVCVRVTVSRQWSDSSFCLSHTPNKFYPNHSEINKLSGTYETTESRLYSSIYFRVWKNGIAYTRSLLVNNCCKPLSARADNSIAIIHDPQSKSSITMSIVCRHFIMVVVVLHSFYRKRLRRC